MPPRLPILSLPGWSGALLAAVVAAAPLPVLAEPIPLEHFFELPAMTAVSISPDGKHIIYRAPMEGRIGVALFDVATGQSEVLVRAADESIALARWKGNARVIFGSDIGGNEAFALQAIDIRNRRIVRIFESFDDREGGSAADVYGSVMAWWDNNPDRLVVFGQPEKGARQVGAYEVNLATGRRTPANGVYDPKLIVTDYVFDGDGRLRGRTVYTGESLDRQVRIGDSDAFTTIERQPADIYEDESQATVLDDGVTMVHVSYREHDRGALLAYDLATGKYHPEPLFVPPEGEIQGLRLSPDDRRVVAVEYGREKPKLAFFDDRERQIQELIDRVLPETFNRTTSMSEDGKRRIILARSDREPGIYFILILEGERPRLMPLGAVNTKLDAKAMRPAQPVAYRARDGLEIHGYLTLPHDRGGPHPFILMVHGGPYGIRDDWEYDRDVQFLASRGYAVLRPNYRGSGGYGRQFMNAGRLEWGAKMQDDLTDAVRWAIAEGHADPARVAIYGGSYGGYAALAGAVFTPELFRAAVNVVGVSDLTLIARWSRTNQGRYMQDLFYDRWVHPDTEVLKQRSPVNFVERIRIPTLHIYGENDPRVDIEHWKRLRAQLDRHGKEYESMEADQGHGFRDAGPLLRQMRLTESFLLRHVPVGGPVPAAPAAR